MKPAYCSQCGTKLIAETCPKCNPKPLRYWRIGEISPHEKQKLFDRIYDRCFEHMVGHFEGEKRCMCECDCKQYIFEEAMCACLGGDIFAQLNNCTAYTFKREEE